MGTVEIVAALDGEIERLQRHSRLLGGEPQKKTRPGRKRQLFPEAPREKGEKH
jgi:hypothetical protein